MYIRIYIYIYVNIKICLYVQIINVIIKTTYSSYLFKAQARIPPGLRIFVYRRAASFSRFLVRRFVFFFRRSSCRPCIVFCVCCFVVSSFRCSVCRRMIVLP